MKLSIKTQLIISFFAVMIPGILFFIGNNIYAKNVVRDKVSETYRNTLDIFGAQTDHTLDEIAGYLTSTSVLDEDVGLFRSYPAGSDEYILTKIRIQNKLQRDVNFYNLVDTMFVYDGSDFIFTTKSASYYRASQSVLQDDINLFINEERGERGGRWMLWYDKRLTGGDFLVRITEVNNSNLYIGAIVKIQTILNQLSIQWDDGAIGESAIYRSDGLRLGESNDKEHVQLSQKVPILQDVRYQFVSDASSGKRYLMMNRPSQYAPITTSIIIPESYMLQGLPYFQVVTYFMAFGIVLIFALYLFFIRRTLFQPLQQLIGGMKKISLGMLDVRLQTNNTVEFVFLANTFNNMAEQIKSLKIGMYEEQLRAQKIELKQLQAQINPHFYMNSLNIIYNFAVLKDTDSVKKMALHLADYFRFIMRSNRDMITVEEELKHIRNYIDIQKFRFPNKLECNEDLPDWMRQMTLPALSLQPFVENAVIHGFVNHREPFYINIRGELAQEGSRRLMVLSVEDNGIGFPADVLERLNVGEQLPSADTSRVGVLNVIQRLRIRYEGAADVHFYNVTAQGGAGVRIRLPLPSEVGLPVEGEEQDVQLARGG